MPDPHACPSCGGPTDDAAVDCGRCVEVDARIEAHIAGAVQHLVESFADVVLPYLHVDDVAEVLNRAAIENARFGEPPRLAELHERALAAIDRRGAERAG